jgi:hypothetical protein
MWPFKEKRQDTAQKATSTHPEIRDLTPTDIMHHAGNQFKILLPGGGIYLLEAADEARAHAVVEKIRAYVAAHKVKSIIESINRMLGELP